MRVRQPETRQEYELEAEPLGTGGEADVYAVPGQAAIVAKVYHKPTPEQADKLKVMLAAPPDDPMAKSGHASIAWPTARLLKSGDAERFAGFLMPRIDQARHINEFYIPKSRQQQCPLFHYGYLMRTARNLAAAVRAVHDRGYVIGDLSGANLLVTAQALVTLIDTDSFQVRSPDRTFRCRVATPEYTPPELQSARFADVDRAPEHDAFGLAVLIFQLLMQGTHPFAGIFTGEGDPAPIPRRIARGHWPYARGKAVPYKPNPHAPPWEALPPMVQTLFLRCFEDGHADPKLRPTAVDWQQGLADAEKELKPCAANAQHQYYRGAASCPWCTLAKQQKRDPFPSVQALKNGAAATVTVNVATKDTAVLDVLPADPPATDKPAVPRRVPAIDIPKFLLRGAIGVACGAGFLIAAVAVAWGTWKFTHRAGNEEPREPPIAAANGSGEKPPDKDPPDVPVDPPNDPPDPPDQPPDKPVEAPEAAPFGEHPSITALTISEDGRRALTGSADGIGRIWDLSSGRLVHRLEGHTKPILTVDFSPDGRQAVTAGEDGTLRLWDATDARELQVFRGQTARAVVFMPDSKKVISAGTDRQWRSWDTVLGQPLQRIPAHAGTVLCLALSADGKRLATGGDDGSVLVWDTATGAKQFDVNKHPGGVRALAFAADNRHLLSAGADNVVRLWDVDNAWEERRWDNLPNCIGLAFVAGGKRAVVALRDNVRLLDVKSGEELGAVKGPRQGGTVAVVTPGEQFVMIASDDRFLHRRRLPKPGDSIVAVAPVIPKLAAPLTKKKPLPTGEILRLEGHERNLRFVRLLPDGQRALSAGEDPWMAVWDLETGKEQRRLEGHTQAVTGLSVSADGKRVLSGGLDGNLILWDLDQGRALQTIAARESIAALALAPDGKSLIASTTSGSIRAWSEEGKELWSTPETKRPPLSLAISADGRELVVVLAEGLMATMDMQTGKETARPTRQRFFALRAQFVGDSRRVVYLWKTAANPLGIWDPAGTSRVFGGRILLPQSLAVSTDGRLGITGDIRGNVQTFNPTTRDLLANFAGHAEVDVGLSADARFVITAGHDRIVRVWDLTALPGMKPKPDPEPEPEPVKDRNVFRGHDGPVDAVAIGPEGRYVLSASAADRTVRQWDVATVAQKRTYLPAVNNMATASFSKDGRAFLTLHTDSSMYTWNVDTGKFTRLPTPPRRPGMPPPPPVLAAALTPDGRAVYALNFDRVLAFSLSSPRPRTFMRLRDAIDTERPFHIADAGRIALFHGPSDAIVMNLITGKEVCRIRNERNVAFFSAALSPDGTTVFTSGVAGAVLWEADNGKEVKKLTTDERFQSAAFSPNGRYLLTGDRRGVVRLFKLETGEVIKTFKGHDQVVNSLAFSSDGRLAVSGSADASVRLWEMPDEVQGGK